VTAALDQERTELLTEAETVAFMQSINAIRLVLGSMLDITDDESADLADTTNTPEHHLYDFLSWLLEWTVQPQPNMPPTCICGGRANNVRAIVRAIVGSCQPRWHGLPPG